MNKINKHTILISGANGEVGHGLITKLKAPHFAPLSGASRGKQNSLLRQDFGGQAKIKIVGLDVNELDSNLKDKVDVFVKGSVTDRDLITKIFQDYKIDTVYHLAAVLSTTGEKNPELAHEVNVGGTFNLLSIANQVATNEKRVIKFIFPSTIAVHGMPNLIIKHQKLKIKEDEFLHPITMYGINKLYCEQLGIYYSSYYRSLSADHQPLFLDFRCLRFPGLISADTIPSGGTSDYAPEMLHAAAKKEPYNCFVRPDSKIAFMAMPDAIDALLMLAMADKKKLKSNVYNIRGFSASAKEIERMVKKHFPKADISYKVNPERQKIIDSWSEDIDDSNAIADWGWKAKYDFKKAFEGYLIPAIKMVYFGSNT